MIKLFHSLDYDVKIDGQGEMISLEAKFKNDTEGGV